MSNPLEKRKLNDWLDDVDYTYLDSAQYVPSSFAFHFMNFIKLVEMGSTSLNKTPPVHLRMLDKVAGDSKHVVNICFRGASKTTLFMEYFSMYLAIFREIPGMTDLSGMIYVSDSIDNGVKSARKNIEFRWQNSPFLQEWLPEATFTDKKIEFTNKEGKKFGINLYGAATGIRGSKIFGERPQIAVLDDLIGDSDAGSEVSMDKIKDTVYKGVVHAMDPEKYKIIFNGTPFNREDIIVEAVESGGWDVNVWPVCEKFPCTREEFKGAWEDRFDYDYVKSQYDFALSNGKVASFYQELMLRISSEDDRLVQDHEIQWYSNKNLMKFKDNFNFYITTDLATSEKQSADFSVISVWALNNRGQWFWVDGFMGRVSLDVALDELFSLVSAYHPMSVGIEATGQQGGFIPWIQDLMMERNVFFNLASSGKQPGIKLFNSKLSKFQLAVPLFKKGNIFFPKELKESKLMVEFLDEIELATDSGLKGKDDFLDTISMLPHMQAWKPSADAAPIHTDASGVWNNTEVEHANTGLDSYIV